MFGTMAFVTGVLTVEELGQQAAPLRPLLRAVVASVLRSPPDNPDVDDAVSETMRRAIEGRARLRPGEPLRAWMVGIAKHVALDAARSRTRALKRQAPGAPDSAAESTRDVTDRIADTKPSPLERATRRQEIERLDAALQALPEKQHDAIVLFYVEGRSYAEIAQQLGVPLGTVATWILRGRQTLAATMKGRD